MQNQIKNEKCLKVMSIFLGILMGGFMWRCRGEGGFGSSWGLYSVGIILMLLIYAVYGRRQKMKYELIPLGAFFLGLGVTGYATVFDQTAGVLDAEVAYQGVEDVYMPVNPYSGILIFFIMGLTLTPFFSFFIGTLFSDKEYKLGHYIGAIAVFFVVSNICKATIAHPILSVINPDQVKLAKLGLIDSGFDYASPAKAYLSHFLDRDWAEDIPFFENYYMSVEHVSDLFGAICLGIYPLVIKKDKLPLITSFVINTFTAIGTTAFSVVFSINYNTGFLANITPIRAFRSDVILTEQVFANGVKGYVMSGDASWSIWEFATGACVGFITMLLIALLPKKYFCNNEIDCNPLEKKKPVSLIFNIIATVFVFSLTPMRAVGIRTGEFLVSIGVLNDSSPVGDIVTVALTVILGIFFIIKIVKNIMKNNTTPLGVTPINFAKIALPAYFGFCVVMYFIIGENTPFLVLPYNEMNSISKIAYIMTGYNCFEALLMFVTLIAVIAIYIPFSKKCFKQNEK